MEPESKKPNEENKDEIKVGGLQGKTVETLVGDMAEVIEGGSGGLMKKIIKSEEEHEVEKKESSPESKQNRIFIMLGTGFIVVSIAVISFFVFKKDIGTIDVARQFAPMIFNEKTSLFEVVGLEKDKIVQKILSGVVNTTVRQGGVEGIYLTENKQLVGLREFLRLMKSSFAPPQNPVFVSEDFMMGVYKLDPSTNSSDLSPGNGFFMLLKVRSVGDIFDSLRAWEPEMFSDLHGLLGIQISADTKDLLDKNFEDGVVGNQNARLLYDKNGNLVLMYVFASDNYVIITDLKKAADEVMLRLSSSEQKQ